MLDIKMEFKQGVLFVRLKGIINGDTSKILEDNLTTTVKNNGIKYLLINFDYVDYIDKYGIDVIIDNYNLIKKSNGKMILCGINKILDYNINLSDNLYQIKEERNAFDLINLWQKKYQII